MLGEKKVEEEHLYIKLERDKCLEEVQDVSNLFLAIEIALEPLGYFGSLTERVKQLVQVVIDKDATMTEENRSLEVVRKHND